jgi:hypothetical protein
MRAIAGFILGFIISLPVFALSVGDLSNQEASGGLKQALLQSSGAAVARLGVTNGFLGNKKGQDSASGAIAKSRWPDAYDGHG